LRAGKRRLVVTNGCFDLLHAGHVTYLEAARNLGDALLVGLTGDAEVARLKGDGRPLNPENDRAAVLAALQSVDAVCVFHEENANRFLSLARPDIYTKGGDYTIDTINQAERRFLEGLGSRIEILPAVPGRSTSALLEKIRPKRSPEDQSIATKTADDSPSPRGRGRPARRSLGEGGG
jgi:D-beta-D-heptose 7-phosphate kinase/D-beta-D-heptose 1-phosphate adenosyltransferase